MQLIFIINTNKVLIRLVYFTTLELGEVNEKYTDELAEKQDLHKKSDKKEQY